MRRFTFSLMILLCLIGCSALPPEPDPVSLINGRNWKEIQLRNGQTGTLLTNNDPLIVASVSSYLSELAYSKSPNQEGAVGFLFYLDLISDEGKQLRVTFLGKTVKVDRIYYDVDQDTVDFSKSLDQQLQQLRK